MRYLPIILALTAGVPALTETIKITAGENNKFDPESVTAKSGDILEFRFGPKNHSVAMGEFDSINGPCVPANEGGFFSGYFAVDSGESVSAPSRLLISPGPVTIFPRKRIQNTHDPAGQGFSSYRQRYRADCILFNAGKLILSMFHSFPIPPSPSKISTHTDMLAFAGLASHA